MQVVVCSKCGTKNRVEEGRLVNSEAMCGRCGATLLTTSASQPETKPVVVTDQTFEHEVLQTSGRPVLVDCWAPWCGPCTMISPVLDQLAAESQGRYRIAKLNVDDNPQTAAQFRIASIPTLLIFKDGELVDRIVGVQPKQAIAERLGVAARSATSH
jgi:thioredoxin 2